MYKQIFFSPFTKAENHVIIFEVNYGIIGETEIFYEYSEIYRRR